MAKLTSCCFNLSPPPSANSSLPSNTSQIVWPRKERSWRSQCVVGVACMIVTLEMGNLMGSQEEAIAGDMHLVVESNEKVKRWSDKRTCPPWIVNSLETIVPENLPRPSAHRRWEAIGYSKIAPPTTTNVSIKTSTSCFSM